MRSAGSLSVVRWLIVVSTTLCFAGCGSGPGDDPADSTGSRPLHSTVDNPVNRSVDDGGEAAGLDQATLLAVSCSGCHAAGGSAHGIASLDGIQTAELEARLLAYRNEPDGGSAMHRMARGYTEQQIAMIANTLGD
jgi:cytochrome c553